MKTWLKKSAWRKSAALLALPVALLLVIIGGALNANPASAQTTPGSAAGDRDALVALYNATGGANWTNNTNWLSDRPITEWHGVYGSGKRVTHLDLKNNNLSGPMPPELGDLTALTILDLQHNNLTGDIPPELANLKIPTIFLNDNNLTGRLPSGLFDKFDPRPDYLSYSDERFKDLDLRNNSGMYGPLPRSLILARPIFSLLFTGTDLCAPGDAEFQTELNALPGIIGTPGTELTNLVTLDQNCTDRQILTALYEDTGGPNWTNSTNWLSDQPLGKWHGVTTDANGRVTVLNLDRNNLTGELPDYLVSLTELKRLAMNRNGLTGTIPSQLGNMPNLSIIGLARNNLSGALPAELGNLSGLTRLSLHDNTGLSGPLPVGIGRMPRLTRLAVSRTGLSGELPQDLVKNGAMQYLHFDDTGLCAPPNAGFQQWLGGVSNALGSNCANRDREALVALYHATDGANWHNNTNWLSNQPVSEWNGIETDTNGNVSKILLRANNLRGSIPAEIGDFANLKVLQLETNWLTGSIPAELGNLTSLTYLNLGWNYLSGEAPAELGNLTNLASLYLDDNSLTGELPQSLTALNELDVFSYSGRVSSQGPCAPYEYEFLQWLEGLDYHGGEICEPDSDRDVLTVFYHYTNGHRWWKRGNWLSDQPLGEWYGVDTNDSGDVTDINLYKNILSGTLPSALGDLRELKSLILTSNQLTGEIPAELGNLTKLEHLWLNNNKLTGGIPAELGNLSALVRLYIQINKLSGEIPAELGNLSALTHLGLGANDLTGHLPAELNNLADAEDIGLTHNDGLCGLEHVEYTGAVLAAINEAGIPTNCRLTEREALIAMYHDMGGPNWFFKTNWLSNKHIRDWYGVIHDDDDRVFSLSLSGNRLTGPISPEVIYLSEMRWLTVDNTYHADTKMTGEIPPYLGKLSKLEILDFANNELTGEVPEELGNLAKLKKLYLNGNSGLTGQLPQSLTNLENLDTFHFQDTGLCAPLDTDFQAWLGTVAETQGSNCAE